MSNAPLDHPIEMYNFITRAIYLNCEVSGHVCKLPTVVLSFCVVKSKKKLFEAWLKLSAKGISFLCMFWNTKDFRNSLMRAIMDRKFALTL